MSSPEQVRLRAAPCQGAGHLQGEDTPDPEVNQDQEKIMAVAVRTLTPHLRVTCYVSMLAVTVMSRASHICVRSPLLRLQRRLT